MVFSKTTTLLHDSGRLSVEENMIEAVKHYLDYLGSDDPVNLYELVLQSIELPLLRVIMKHTSNNQSRAASILGMSRGTLRKKLKHYDMLKEK